MPSIAIALIAIGLSPLALYLMLKRPLIFPLGIYIVLVPIDGLLLGTTTTLTRLVAIATGLALLFHMITTRRVLAPPKSWAVWAMYVVLASLTALWTIDSDRSLLTITQLLQLFVFFTIIAIYPVTRKDVKLVGTSIVASGLLISLLGLGSYFQGFRFQDRLSVFFKGVMLDPNHLAAGLLLPIALTVGTFLETRDVRLRLVSVISAIIMTATLFLTGSRGAFIALAVMLLYIAWRTRYRLQILAVMAVTGLASLLQPTVWDRFSDKGLGGGSGRVFIWDAARLALKDHWLFGAGIGAFPAAYNHELFAMYQPVFQGWSRPAHNAFLSAAVEVGIFGGILHLYAWWKSYSDSRGNVVIEAAIIALATASFFLDVLEFKYIWLAFMMAVLVKNAAEPNFLRGQAQPAPRRTRRFIGRPRLPWRFSRTVTTSSHPSTDNAVANI